MKYVLSIFLIICSISAQADNSNQYVQKLLQSFETGKYHSVFAKAMVETYSDIGQKVSISEANSQIEPLLNSFKELHENSGKYHGYELIASKSLGSKYKREKYILYYDSGIVMLNLELYAPRGKWGVRKYKFSSKIGVSWQ